MSPDRRIILIEDDVLISMMLVDMVDALGYGEPVIAASVSEALAAIERGGIAAALLDINLSEEKGWPVADALAAAQIPFAFSTGGGDTVPPGHSERPLVAKPFRLADIESLFEELLG